MLVHFTEFSTIPIAWRVLFPLVLLSTTNAFTPMTSAKSAEKHVIRNSTSGADIGIDETATPEFLAVGDDPSSEKSSYIAYHLYSPSMPTATTSDKHPILRPGVLFCGGFSSSMTGNKAIALEAQSRELGLRYCRFDYRGHGSSSGSFIDHTLSDWIQDTKSILDHAFPTLASNNGKSDFGGYNGKVVLVGSSMGGWIALHIAQAFPDRIAGIIGVATAPDFLHSMQQDFTVEQSKALDEHGIVTLESDYDIESLKLSHKLLEDAEQWRVFNTRSSDNRTNLDADTTVEPAFKVLPIPCPVRLLHGQLDDDVPWQRSLELSEILETNDVTVTIIKNGDHRLSSERDLKLLKAALLDMTS